MLRPWKPVFAHGDLQLSHVFSDGDEGTGRIDWPEASRGEALCRPRQPDARHEEHRLGAKVSRSRASSGGIRRSSCQVSAT
jgi:hypothetical protein